MQNNSNGCIIFAYNTDKINYFNQAEEAANRVVKYLNLPVTIITNQKQESKHNVIITETPPKNYKQRNIWYNRSRTGAFDITPYSKTLVIDSDYFLCTSNLLPHIQSQKSFLISSEVYNPKKAQKVIHYLGKTRIPMLWATIMIFDRSNETKCLFELAKNVEKHYQYYSQLYGFNYGSIRNDYIFSIACHLMGGYGINSYALKNYPLINCDSEIVYEKFTDNKLIYKYIKDKVYGNRLQNIDLHLMNKGQI